MATGRRRVLQLNFFILKGLVCRLGWCDDCSDVCCSEVLETEGNWNSTQRWGVQDPKKRGEREPSIMTLIRGPSWWRTEPCGLRCGCSGICRAADMVGSRRAGAPSSPASMSSQSCPDQESSCNVSISLDWRRLGRGPTQPYAAVCSHSASARPLIPSAKK